MPSAKSVPVTVIIPCYNGEKFVGAAIESALNQSLPVDEIIIVDDGSTDGSIRVVEGFAKVKPAIVRSIRQANAGSSLARMAAIQVARHNDIMALDADDMLHPEAIASLWPRAQANPGHAVLYGDYFHVNESGEIGSRVSMKARRTDPLDGRILATVLWENVVSATVLLRRDKVVAVGGYSIAPVYSTVDGFEDVFLYMRMLAAGFQFAYVDCPIFYYRTHAGNNTRKPGLVNAAMQSAFAYMFEHAPAQMAEAFLRMRSWRAEQLRDAFATIEARDAALLARDTAIEDLTVEINRARVFQNAQQELIAARDSTIGGLTGEIERAREFQAGLEYWIQTQDASLAAYRAEIERARRFQAGLEARVLAQDAKLAEYVLEIERAREFQERLLRAIDTQNAGNAADPVGDVRAATGDEADATSGFDDIRR